MKLIENNDYQCAAASFAMVMNTTADDIIERLGHNGLDKILPKKSIPLCYRGFHPQEFADLLIEDGYSMTMIELNPMMRHGDTLVNHSKFLGHKRFSDAMSRGDGVIFGSVEPGERGHAVAWNSREKMIYDPRGSVYPYGDTPYFSPKQFFLIQKVHTSWMTFIIHLKDSLSQMNIFPQTSTWYGMLKATRQSRTS